MPRPGKDRKILRRRSGDMLDMKTIDRYKSAAYNSIVERVTHDENVMARVRKLISE